MSRADCMGAASAASRDSGLVPESTSGTASPDAPIVVNTRLERFKRLRYNVIASSTMIDAPLRKGGHRWYCGFGTLTYRPDVEPSAGDCSAFVKRLRQWMGRCGEKLRLVWVAELHESGRLHYHFIVWMPHGFRIPKPDKPRRVGLPNGGYVEAPPMWPHGWSNIKAARSPVGYLAKYAGKLKGKAVDGGFALPKGFRCYGVAGLDQDERQARAWANLPGWMRCRVSPAHRVARAVGGGWFSRVTLEFWPSIFQIVRVVRAGGGAFVSVMPALPEGVELCL